MQLRAAAEMSEPEPRRRAAFWYWYVSFASASRRTELICKCSASFVFCSGFGEHTRHSITDEMKFDKMSV